jgi:uncharacterized membrane protein
VATLAAMTTKAPSSLGNDFLAGLAVCLPAVISIGVLLWLFGAVSNITDKLLFAGKALSLLARWHRSIPQGTLLRLGLGED